MLRILQTGVRPRDLMRGSRLLSATTGLPGPRQVLEDIDEVLETIVRPYAQLTAATLYFTISTARKERRVRMEGACEDCPSSTVTLRFKVLSAMKHYCPEVTAVKRVDLDEDSDSDSDQDPD